MSNRKAPLKTLAELPALGGAYLPGEQKVVSGTLCCRPAGEAAPHFFLPETRLAPGRWLACCPHSCSRDHPWALVACHHQSGGLWRKEQSLAAGSRQARAWREGGGRGGPPQWPR